MKDALLQQFKKRRLALGLKQGDMLLRVGISRQQYQSLESKGNPRLDTLALIAEGLNSEIMLIPKEKLSVVQTVLARGLYDFSQEPNKQSRAEQKRDLSEDPWRGLLGDKS